MNTSRLGKRNLKTTKTVSAVFHLNNKEAKRELKSQPQQQNPVLLLRTQILYLGVTLDRSLTYRRHLESLCRKSASCIALLRRLVGSGWGAGATTLRIATLALDHSTAENCAPVWCGSAHTRLIDPAINDAFRIVTGCLRPTPADNITILAGIQPAELRRKAATLSLARRAMEPAHLLHSALTCPPSGNARNLKSRHPFVSAANKSSVHLPTTTEVRRTGRITNGRRSGWTTLRDSVLSSPTPAPTFLE